MLAENGSVFLILALAAALYAAGAALRDARRGGGGAGARAGVYATTALLGLALAALWAAFLGDRFQLACVARHSNRALPLPLKIAALWAGQEGSLLLWTFLQSLYAALLLGRPTGRVHPLMLWASVFLSLIVAFFIAVTLFLSNPFALLATAPPDGRGLNPLLRHPAMVFHPPALYLGYVGLATPFALALAALITRQVEGWTAVARRWALAAWFFLGLGLILGARWAYDVLGWGGYWAWDPVENAGLMPWLTATAFLHGAAIQRKRGTFRVWNVLLAVLSFVLVLFGAFTARSGVIQSVHAYTQSNLGPCFLAAIGLTAAGAAALMLVRRAALASPPASEGLFSREGMFFLTLVLLTMVTASVFIGSVFPTAAELLSGKRVELGAAWFDRVAGPQIGAVVLLMGVCLLLGRARRRYGGYLAHAGVILMAVGVIGTRLYPFETELTLAQGRPASVQGYTLVLETVEQSGDEHRLSAQATLSVSRGDARPTTLRPRVEQYPASGRAVGIPAVHTSLREDLYIVLMGMGSDGETVTLRILINPLAAFLWIGALTLLAGGLVALCAKTRIGVEL